MVYYTMDGIQYLIILSVPFNDLFYFIAIDPNGVMVIIIRRGETVIDIIPIGGSGGGGSGNQLVSNEVPMGTINAVNTTFSLVNTPVVGSVRLFKRGLRQYAGTGNDFTISGNIITFAATSIPIVGDNLLADYEIE